VSIPVEDVINILRKLIRALLDSQEGYRLAAEHAQSEDLKVMFMAFSTQRAQFAGELQNEVLRLGMPDPPFDRSFTGALQRTWIKLKTALASDKDRLLLTECEAAEDRIVEAYDDALRERLPRYIRDRLEEQLQEVGAARAYLAEVESRVSHEI
jgi:uncharacterized protein (TIGR02284 family)